MRFLLGRYYTAFIKISKASLIQKRLRAPLGLLNVTNPLPSMPTYKFFCHLPKHTLQGQMLVTKSLKAELPKALALDSALVNEGASGELWGDL